MSDLDRSLIRFRTEFSKARIACGRLTKRPLDLAERALDWSSFTQAIISASRSLIDYGKMGKATRGISHRLKNRLENDKIYKYVLASRNAEVHAEERQFVIPNPVKASSLNIGGAIEINGSGRIFISDSFINGHYVNGQFELAGDNAKIHTTSNVPVTYMPYQILMSNVVDKYGNVHVFPFDLVSANELPEVFAVTYLLSLMGDLATELGVDMHM